MRETCYFFVTNSFIFRKTKLTNRTLITDADTHDDTDDLTGCSIALNSVNKNDSSISNLTPHR